MAALVLLLPGTIRAQQVAGDSAILEAKVASSAAVAKNRAELGIEKHVIKSVLKRYNSPMADSVDSFIRACTTYNFDCYLLPSISGLESTFGRAVAPGTYNPYGWGRGFIPFTSWDEANLAVAKGLRENYMSRGALTVDQIGPIYSESPTWALRVNTFMNQFKAEEAKYKLLFNQNQVEL